MDPQSIPAPLAAGNLPDPLPLRDPSWRRAGTAWLLCALVVLAVLWPAASTMVQTWWTSGTYSHALAVPFIVGGLVWRLRAQWLSLPPSPDPRWWPALGAAGLLAAAGDAALANAPSHLALVALLVLTVPALLGTAVARCLAFPLGYAFFMVPIGDFLLPSMMEATATFTVWALRLTGVPVYREGLDFVIPSGHWSVVEACSGVRYLIASLSVGVLFAFLTYRSLKRRLVFVGLAIAVPVVANWLRAYLIVMLGHLTDNRLAAGVDHLIYGWVFFGVVIGLLFVVGARWAEDGQGDSGSWAGQTDGRAAALGGPCGTGAGNGHGHSFALWGAAALSVLLACGPQLGLMALRAGQDPSAHRAGGLQPWPWPSPWEGPQSMDLSQADWRPGFSRPDAEEVLRYRWRGDPDAAVEVHRVTYETQGLVRRLPLSGEVPDPVASMQWQRVASRQWPQTDIVVRVGGQQPDLRLKVHAWRHSGSGGSPSGDRPSMRLSVQLLRVEGVWLEPGPRARQRLALDRMQGRPGHAQSWTLSVPVDAMPSGHAQDVALREALHRLQQGAQAMWASAPR